MRRGKQISSGAHASLKAILDKGRREVFMSPTSLGQTISISMNDGSALHDWINGLYTKITVSVNSEAELDELYEKAKSKGLICSMIVDAGLTEFHGTPTKTCIAIGPCWNDELIGLTDHLPLL